MKQNVHCNDDDFYEDLIKILYKPSSPIVGSAIVQELPFEVEPAPDPEPAIVETEHEEETNEMGDIEEEQVKAPTFIDKLKDFLLKLSKTVSE